jgi:hypothetical protein
MQILMTKRVTMRKTDDKKGCHEESDDKDQDSNDAEPLFTVS